MTLYRPDGSAVSLDGLTPIGAGAEGVVYGGPVHPDRCVKVYFTPSAALDRRHAGLRRLPPAGWSRPPVTDVGVAWPGAELRDDHRWLRAVVLPRVDGVPLHDLFHVRARVAAVDHPTWATNVLVAERVARLFEHLHGARVVVGDVSSGNLLVDRAGRVTMIDCDGVQFVDRATGERFPAAHVTPEYASPEALADPAGWLTRAHDLFGLAVLVYQLLMEGDHPFAGVPVDGPDVGVEGNIVAGACRLADGRLRPVRGGLPVEVLPPEVRALARRALVDGHARPAARPTAVEWLGALRAAASALVGCRREPYHVVRSGSADCVWCRRREAGLGEHFPPVGAETGGTR
ncbi:protein kinase [Micromonospora sp. WMMD882]|uniref:protein kinase domain-containing protein n=1 Tax=Micromonospora sp. WMMD882 TaxID=3015151 RepID=UPI00248A9815|nr:protein kinase [Micromonospora sp. WMMD882]WBB77771.1 protein kinase [Micromonospora sp. WMMD882]